MLPSRKRRKPINIFNYEGKQSKIYQNLYHSGDRLSMNDDLAMDNTDIIEKVKRLKQEWLQNKLPTQFVFGIRQRKLVLQKLNRVS
ncbi:hypothetical protein MIMGU_mgv1a017268mg [Erythranthe guttata]|uniref:Uncharacterized protein n=1 Tax=Erythranthe guttata TaxID=4155 RepID=A0A022R9W8_ERYGU|nr:hypothetical protein MIMGU_mgv1a017268mg [Erythranthe guttata]